jgi:16S rRNA C967 or C1407 C5-methylase (RsmB/RsmF family)
MKNLIGGVAMRNQNLLTQLLEATSNVEVYKLREELREKLIKGFSPDEAKEFISELLKLRYDYLRYKRHCEEVGEVLSKFAELIAYYTPIPEKETI